LTARFTLLINLATGLCSVANKAHSGAGAPERERQDISSRIICPSRYIGTFRRAPYVLR